MLQRCLIFFLLSISCFGQGNWGTTQNGITTGVTNIDIPAANGSTPSYTFISSAYTRETVYGGLVDAINGSVLYTQSMDNQLNGNADISSTVNGHVFNILGHVGDDVIINLAPDQSTTYFALYDSVQIIKATTLESLFGSGEDFTGLSGTPAVGDNILIWSSIGWKVYFHYNDKWQTFGTRADQGGSIIYPDEGMVYVRRGIAHILSFSGLVPPSIQSYLPGPAGKFLMSNPFPMTQTISQLIDTTTNWIQSNDPNDADQILSWSGSAWVSYYNNIADDWINVATGQVDDYEFQPGESFFIIRSSTIGTGVVPGYNKIDL